MNRINRLNAFAGEKPLVVLRKANLDKKALGMIRYRCFLIL